MRLLANENFPGAAIVALRARGHDVIWIRESHSGSKDDAILAMAVADSRILITFDKDFGELAFKSKMPVTTGIVLFRIRKQSPDFIAHRAIEILESRSDWAGNFSVAEDDRLRVTRLPASA